MARPPAGGFQVDSLPPPAANRLPMRFDNLSIQKRRQELEAEIDEVEASVKKFSRKEVYVAV